MLVTDITTIINKGISVGLDAEWRPRNYLSTVVWEDAAAAGEAVAGGDGEQEDGLLPIAVLQLATRTRLTLSTCWHSLPPPPPPPQRQQPFSRPSTHYSLALLYLNTALH